MLLNDIKKKVKVKYKRYNKVKKRKGKTFIPKRRKKIKKLKPIVD